MSATRLLVVLFLLFLGYMAGKIHTTKVLTERPSEYECLQLESNWAREECVRRYYE